VGRREPGDPPALRADHVAADATLRRGVVALGVPEDDVDGRVERALERLVDDGVLLGARVAGRAGPERWVLVNGRDGRAALELLRTGDLVLPDLPRAVAAAVPDRPNVFAQYEENIGPLTPMLAEELREAADSWPPSWIEDAIRLAVENNVRKWSYVRAILERWSREGRDDGAHRQDPQTARERYLKGPFADHIEH
jgi:DnaD/phage-associated family protein